MGNTAKNSKEWWEYVLGRANIPYCDGRAVFKYELDKDDISKARSILLCNANAVKEGRASARLYGLFVCYAAEVFKRNASSTKREWNPILSEIGFENEPNKIGKWCEAGLRFLGKKPRETAQGRQWLQTIQLLGGFPMQAIVSADGGWIKPYLKAICKSALAYHAPIDLQTCDNIIRENLNIVTNSTFRADDDFRELSKELVRSLQELWCIHRIDLPEGFSFKEWLAYKEPNWKKFLPIRVPEEYEAAVFSLLADEIEEAAKSHSIITANKVVRGLAWQNGAYVPTVSIEFQDKFKPNFHALGKDSRLRLIAAGELSKYVGSDLAHSNPPANDEDRWKVRAAKIENIKGFPLSAGVEAVWRNAKGDEDPCTFIGHSNKIIGFVHVYAALDDRNLTAKYIGTGSVATQYEKLLVVCPPHAILEGLKQEESEDDIFEEIGETKDGLKVHLTNQSLLVTNIENNEKYRITPKSIARNFDIYSDAIYNSNWEPLDNGIDVGCLPIKIKENGISRNIRAGEVFWRKDRFTEWNDYFVKQPNEGKHRIKWVDKEAGHILVSKNVFLLPKNMEICAKLDGNRVLVETKNSLATNILLKDNRIENTSPSQGVFRTNPSANIECAINSGGDELLVSLKVKIAKNCFVDLLGNLIKGELRIDGLKGAFANSRNQNCALVLKVNSNGLANAQIAIVNFPKGKNQLPLYELENVIWQLIAIEIDPDVTIEISWIDGYGEKLIIKPFDPPLAIQIGGVFESSIPKGSKLCFRSLSQPWNELDALESKEFAINGLKFFNCPEDIKLPALMYTRIDDFVNTRPRIYLGKNIVANSELERISLIENQVIRKQDYRNWFNEVPIDESAKIVAQIAKSLKGFPLTCLDIMTCIPDNVLVAALLRHPNERDEIFNLQKELPFHWITIPQKIWINEIEKLGCTLTDVLLPIRGNIAPLEVFGQISTILESISEYDELLRFVFIKYLENKDACQSAYKFEQNYYFGQMQSAIFLAQLPKYYYPQMDYNPVIKAAIPIEFLGAINLPEVKNWFIAPIVAAYSTIGKINPTLNERLGFFIARREFPDEFESIFAKIVMKEGLNV